jgi:hypothetical protein
MNHIVFFVNHLLLLCKVSALFAKQITVFNVDKGICLNVLAVIKIIAYIKINALDVIFKIVSTVFYQIFVKNVILDFH